MKKSALPTNLSNNALSQAQVDVRSIDTKREYRCKHCHKLLGIEKFEIPSLEIKCLRCGMITPLFLNTEKQVILTDKNGKLLYVNSQFENVTGYKAKEVLGKTPAIWGGQMPVGFYKKLWHDISIKKRSVAVLLTNRKKNGDFYSVSLRISPILDVYGNIEVFLGIETLLKEKKI